MNDDEAKDAIADAIRADAESARTEIRAMGILCPSCGINMADLPDGHHLELSGTGIPVASCGPGKTVTLDGTDWDALQAAATITVFEEMHRLEDKWRPAGDWQPEGLLAVLLGEGSKP